MIGKLKRSDWNCTSISGRDIGSFCSVGRSVSARVVDQNRSRLTWPLLKLVHRPRVQCSSQKFVCLKHSMIASRAAPARARRPQ